MIGSISRAETCRRSAERTGRIDFVRICSEHNGETWRGKGASHDTGKVACRSLCSSLSVRPLSGWLGVNPRYPNTSPVAFANTPTEIRRVVPRGSRWPGAPNRMFDRARQTSTTGIDDPTTYMSSTHPCPSGALRRN